jgi:RHS repeat-associated protein
MRNYFEFYTYDEVGNILLFDHKADNGNWIRTYKYNEDSLIETGKKSNRLSSTTVSGATASYKYDEHGNMTRMPHFANLADQPNMNWDSRDMLQMVDKGGGSKAYYVYDAAGQRVRKVIEQNATLMEERIYIGGYEVYRKYNGSSTGPILERESLHIMDDKQRIALVDTKTIDTKNTGTTLPETLIRYQFGNHLGSAALELDNNADIISYEEYYPYGSTSYQAVRSNMPGSVEVSTKRYRYTGKERDEETGLYYHGARYYAPWLGRWVSCDPKASPVEICLYLYCHNNPSRFLDPDGADSFDPMKDHPFARWLLYGKDTPVRDFITNDRNLKAAQVAIAVTTVTVVSGGVGGEIAVGLGATAVEAGAIGGGIGGAAGSFESASFEGRLPTSNEVAVSAGTGAILGGAAGYAQSTLIPKLVARSAPKPSIAPEPATQAPVADPTPTTPASTTPATPIPAAEPAPTTPAAPAPAAEPAPTALATPAPAAAAPIPEAPTPIRGGQPRPNTHQGSKFHYTNVADPDKVFAGGVRRGTSFTGEGNLGPKAAITRLGIPRPTHVVEVEDVGQFVPNKPPTVQPNPNRGFVGGGSDYVNPIPIPPEQIKIYPLGRNGPIR